MTAIYVTVDCYCAVRGVRRPPCQGCTSIEPSGSAEPRRAGYKIVGASGDLALCRDCAIHAIKSLAARFAMLDPSATRDLMDFFAAGASAPKSRRAKRRSPRRVIDVAASLQLEEGKKAP